MGSKPKASEYKASPAEQASAAVALAENNYFKEKYDPLLQKARDDSRTDDSGTILRGRANADTMQTLAGNASYDRAATGDAGGAEAQAYQAQLGLADKAGKDIKNTKQLGVLGTARGQVADAQSGMGAAANMGASKVLNDAAAKQQVRSAKTAALGQIGTAVIMQGAKNMKTSSPVMKANGDGQVTKDGIGVTKKGSFFSPVNEVTGEKISGFGNRLGYTGFSNTNPFGP